MEDLAKSLIYRIRSVIAEPFLFNSLNIIVDAFFGTFLGFLFWMICAKLYHISDIGFMTAIVAAQYFITRLANIGADSALVRYLPTSKNKESLIGNLFLISSSLTVALSVGYIATIGRSLSIFKDNLSFQLLFILSTLLYSVFLFIEPIFLSRRETSKNLIKNSSSNIIKLLLCFMLSSFGFLGIFLAWNIAMLIPLGLILIHSRLMMDFNPRIDLIKKISKFSFSNYISGFFATTYRSILQYLVLMYLGVAASAQFFFLYTLVSLSYFISDGFSQSLFVEGSYDAKILKKKIRMSVLYSAYAIIPFMILFAISWSDILSLLGKEYTQLDPASVYLLLSTSVLSIPYSSLMSFLKIKKSNNKIIIYNSLFFISIIGISFILLSKGLLGISIGIFCGYLLMTFIAASEYLMRI